ncbi:hypothetical protein EYF80_046220 [Liparis tanakae]|uniref:Uncharacterized protein n=1 Tax=Liparis tanakae TaxID=230148 RepID=A0A4Z2FT86_9TELE|nr:hypothetical protein EYF80_046220 [Liparis tanakae]
MFASLAAPGGFSSKGERQQLVHPDSTRGFSGEQTPETTDPEPHFDVTDVMGTLSTCGGGGGGGGGGWGLMLMLWWLSQ